MKELLPMAECIPLMAEALISFAEGKSRQPVRTIFRPPEARGLMGLMPSYRSEPRPVFGLKAICVFPGNTAKGKDAHQGAVLLFSAETGEPLAIENASAITAIRTAAVSAVASDLLARKDAGVLAIIGAGIQGRAHLEAISRVRKLTNVRIADKEIGRAEKLAEEARSRYSFPVAAMKSVESAVREADMVITVTNSSEPIIRREWVADGTTISAVGACTPTTREIDSRTVAASKLFVDNRAAILQESGDYLLALKEGAIGPDHIQGEIGELLIGAKPGRTTDKEIVLFKSLGLAVEDLAAAEYAYRKARETNRGTEVEF
jgi:ornithine cyclodeaminase